MKRQFLLLVLILFCICLPVSFAGTVYEDGFITEGEYAYGVQWFSYDPPLIVEGGGADAIEVKDYGHLEVRYTSMPLSNTSGIWDIWLDDCSTLNYLGGITDIITISENANSALKGGEINHILSYQYANTKHIDLYCQPGWSWLYTSSEIKGISGLWETGTSFTIDFIDDDVFGYDPVWENINIIEIPEPATLLLLGLGGLLLRRKK